MRNFAIKYETFSEKIGLPTSTQPISRHEGVDRELGEDGEGAAEEDIGGSLQERMNLREDFHLDNISAKG